MTVHTRPQEPRHRLSELGGSFHSLAFADSESENCAAEGIGESRHQAVAKLWHAMRASRQTELLAEFPAKDVSDWLGNSQAVAMKFYAMATIDTFQRAVCCSTRGSISATQEQSRDIVDREKPLENSGLTSEENLLKTKRLDDTGLERFSRTACFSRSAQHGLRSDAENDATSPDLQKLIALWPRLDDDSKAQLLAFAERALDRSMVPAGH